MNFKLPYEEAKKLLHVFYQSPYQVSAPFVHMLDNLSNEEGVTLRQSIEAEIATNNKEAITPEILETE